METNNKIYQIYDWYTYDEEIDDDYSDSDSDSANELQISNRFIAYMFCITETGDNVSIKVQDFTPFFWVELPMNWKEYWTIPFLNDIQKKLPKSIRGEFITDRPLKKTLRYRYKFGGYQWNKKRPFLQLVFVSEKCLRRVYYLLKKPYNFSLANLNFYSFAIYEKNIPPILRLIHLRKLKPSSWVKLGTTAKLLKSSLAETNFKYNYVVDWKDIHNVEKDTIGPLKIASFDIEADSSHGDFPVAKKDYYKLAMNIYDEYVRLRKQKKRVTPVNVKMWIKAAFREYTQKDYNQNIKSSIQNIVLKDPILQDQSDIIFHNIEDVSNECFRELSKQDSKKGKEIVISLTNILNDAFPKVQGDKVIQIGTVLYEYGNESNSIIRHIITLGGCSSIPNAIVVCCKTVKELFIEWVKFLNKIQPNILTGYNINGFDFKFLWDCADEYGCQNILKNLGAFKYKDSSFVVKELTSAALGHVFNYYIDIPGIVGVDLMKVVQKDYNLSNYSLDSVSTEFINGMITNVEHDKLNSIMILNTSNTFSLKVGNYIAIYESSIIGNEYIGERKKILSIVENVSISVELCEDDFKIPENPKSYFWCVGKDTVNHQDIFAMQKGSDADRGIVAKYCIQDCELCLNLIQKLEIVTNNIGMSNVCLVPFSYLFSRGQMIKTLSLVSSECLKLHYLIPELPKPPEDVKDSYEGAEVLEPCPSIYLNEPISVLDYGSLYPSSMIGTNISHDTIITDQKYFGKSGEILLKKLSIDFEDVTYDNYISVLVGKTWKKKIHKTHPQVTCRYVKPPKINDKIDDSKRGILPKILMKLLEQRKNTRQLIKTEKDPFRRSVLDGLQLAYKVTANSLYGGVGAAVSALYYKDIAASTTAVGRQHLHLAKDYVNKHFPKAKVVYGDSVVSDTPILIKYKNKMSITTPEDLYNKFETIGPFKDVDPFEKSYINCSEYFVWTEQGWTKINQVMRHKVKKRILRVLTHTSSVDVTEDHSLLDVNAIAVTPNKLNIGDKLLTSFPDKISSSKDEISNNFARIIGFFFGDGTCGIYNSQGGIKASWKITNTDIQKIKYYEEICSKEIPEFKWKIYNTKNRRNHIWTLEFNGKGKKKYIEKFNNLLYHETTKSKQVPNCILNGSHDIKKAFIIGLYDADGHKSTMFSQNTKHWGVILNTLDNSGNCYIDHKGKIAVMGIFTILKSLNYDVYITCKDVKNNIYRINFTSINKSIQNSNEIKQIIDLGTTEQFVYDLSTQNHHFQAGIGNCIVHNTDSIFVNFNPILENEKPIEQKEAIQSSIDSSIIVEKGIQKLLQYPHKLEYEKTFYPFILLRKKGYIGNKYEFDLNKFKQTSMGVVTKRRDNAPILKYIYDGIIKKIINEKDIDGAIQFLNFNIQEILNGKFPMHYFIITKKLKAQYANPEQIVHKVLADRRAERDPGNKPQSNDRIPYVYIKTKNIPKLQGDRVEDPEFITQNNLKIDYLFYITNQIQKPVCQVFALALEDLRKYGYKKEKDYFKKIEKQLKIDKKEPAVIREKIMILKMDEVYNVLFKRIVKIEEGKRYGQSQISDFFIKKYG